MKRYIKSTTGAETFEDGYNKAMELSRGNTYMYDSTRRIFELAAKDPNYETATDDYKGGFAAAVYDLFRC